MGGKFFAVTQSNLCGMSDTAATHAHILSGTGQSWLLTDVRHVLTLTKWMAAISGFMMRTSWMALKLVCKS